MVLFDNSEKKIIIYIINIRKKIEHAATAPKQGLLLLTLRRTAACRAERR